MVAKPHLSDTDTINSVSLKGALEHCFCLDNNAHRKKASGYVMQARG